MSSLEPQRLWRSLNELEGTPEFEEFVKKEFPEQAEVLKSPFSRRRFMQLMGASLSLAGVSACRWEQDRIVPLGRRPQDYIPGVPKKYATTMELGGSAQALIATSYDGRPISVAPNREHPSGAAGTTSFSQASILSLYDPDRSTAFRRSNGPTPTAADIRSIFDAIKAAGGDGFHVLCEATSSPTVLRLRDQLRQSMPGMRWHEWEAISRDNEREGTRLAFGAPHRVHLAVQPGTQEQAAVIVAIDADLAGDHSDGLRLAREITRARAPEAGEQLRVIPRIYSLESAFSTTGALADHRFPVRPSHVPRVLGLLEDAIKGGSPEAFGNDRIGKFLRAIYSDLTENRGRGILAVGYRQPPEVHAQAARINGMLGNNGQNVRYSVAPDAERPTHAAAIGGLVTEMRKGSVKTLLILGGNPVYDAPAELNFVAALTKVPQSIHLSSHFDETSSHATLHIPRAHYLESWGDSRSYDGTASIVQPLIDPMYPDCRNPIDLLKILAGKGDIENRSIIMETYGTNDRAFTKIVHDGYVPNTAFATVSVNAGGAAQPAQPLDDKAVTQVAQGQVEVVFMPSNSTYDGRFANNGWMQELPDLMTKLTWDNALVVGPQTANVLKIKDHDVVSLTIGKDKVELPVYVLPGVAPSTVLVALGYGRTRAGHIGGLEEAKVAPIGRNVYPLRTSAALYLSRGDVANTGKKYRLASTQDHWAIDDGGKEATEKRATMLIMKGSIGEYQTNPNFVTKHAEIEGVKPLIQTKTAGTVNKSLWAEHSYDGYKWGMAIDLSKCLGCGACVTACQAENNIAVVGKEQVIKNREMHWIRVDRYFSGDPNSPEMLHQPVTCQHCENAPCEQVCPVGATIHSNEGLNDMAYNRCVGTRYCLNNCPYKVRRFNYHYWWKELDEPKNESRKLAFNPEVTVRSRGVMEKCTFCVQRIQNAKIGARNKGERLKDGDVQTACQQACATDAIVFGDLNIDSEVKRAQTKPRSYALLAELNNKPRNAYMARITNPHPSLVKAEEGKGHE